MSKETRTERQFNQTLKTLNDAIQYLGFYSSYKDIKIPKTFITQDALVPVHDILERIDPTAAQNGRRYIKAFRLPELQKALEGFSADAKVRYYQGGIIVDEMRQRTPQEYEEYVTHHKRCMYNHWKSSYEAAIKRRDDHLNPPNPKKVQLEKLAKELGYDIKKA